MTETTVIGAADLLRQAPELVRGLPRKLKGFYTVAKQQKNPVASIALCLEEAARKYPDRPAVVFEGASCTYKEFNQRANQIARHFEKTGTKRSDVVVVAMENRTELLLVVAALSKIGAVSALINTSQRGEVLSHSVRLVKAKRVVVGEELIEAFQEVNKDLPTAKLDRIFVPENGSQAKAPDDFSDYRDAYAETYSTQNLESSELSRSKDPACYFYTSGTTGLPKAAVLTNGRFLKAFGGIGNGCIQLKQSDRVYVCLPFYHATAMVIAWSSVLAGGASLILARKFSASRFWQDIVEQEATAICYIGELCRYLVNQKTSALDKAHKVRLMFGNGMRPEIWGQFKKRFGIERVHEFYGSSEGNVGFINVLNLENTVGFTPVPYAIVEYDVENDEAIRYHDGFMRKVKKGEAGLLLGEINDKSPFDGYTENEKTEKTILRNVFKQGDAWFNTGDMMRDMGFRHAQFVDRLGDTFRWKGENVSTTEVENIISRLEFVNDAVVYGVEIPKTNGRAGMAAITLNPGHKLDLKSLLSELQKNLPDYAVPVFVRVLDEIEKTGTHKYKKAPLKNDAFDPKACGKQVYVREPGANEYVALTPKLHDSINAGEKRF